ncbi:MAG: putative toxin-antitoxin system toxin component, PIN family [Thermaerobacter sp.]|nr:putative toxin-antitoxin system toxin component, PIN family [Thermaerobacter sp.]
MNSPNARLVIVLDTNVVVSALLKADSPQARLLATVLRGRLRIAFDARILTEYRHVLLRPKVGFDPARVGILLEALEREGIAVAAQFVDVSLPDPDDRKFLEVASALDPPAVLITGNTWHFPSELCGQVRVEAPREFLEHLSS